MMIWKLPRGEFLSSMLYGNLDKASYDTYNDLLMINQTHGFLQKYHLGGCWKRILLGNGASQQPRKASIPWLVPHWPVK